MHQITDNRKTDGKHWKTIGDMLQHQTKLNVSFVTDMVLNLTGKNSRGNIVIAQEGLLYTFWWRKDARYRYAKDDSTPKLRICDNTPIFKNML